MPSASVNILGSTVTSDRPQYLNAPGFKNLMAWLSCLDCKLESFSDILSKVNLVQRIWELRMNYYGTELVS